MDAVERRTEIHGAEGKPTENHRYDCKKPHIVKIGAAREEAKPTLYTLAREASADVRRLALVRGNDLMDDLIAIALFAEWRHGPLPVGPNR